MDEEHLPPPWRGIITTAIAEALRRGAPAVAPEHLLLALAGDADAPAGAILADFGLDHDAVDRALDQERARSLAVVGIGRLDEALLQATPRLSRPGWASATRDVFRRAQAGGRSRRRRTAELDVLAGIITANVGTVPRALVCAGVSRDRLIGRVERERWAGDGGRPLHQGVSAQQRQALRREALRQAQQARRDALQRAQQARRDAAHRTPRRRGGPGGPVDPAGDDGPRR